MPDSKGSSKGDSKSKVHVQYTGRASVRALGKADFEAKGITDQDDVEFNHDNRWVAEVSPEAAGLLVGMGDFNKMTADEAKGVQEPDDKPVQQVPEMGEVVPGEKRRGGGSTPYVTQDEPDSKKES